MLNRYETLVHRLLHRRFRKRWERLADDVDKLELPELKLFRRRARQVARPMQRFVHRADHRLALPVIGSNAIQAPVGTDWRWRPELWRGPVAPSGHAAVRNKTRLGGEATVFHDCKVSELTFRQIRNTRESDLAPFGLRLDVFRFDGGFLSLAMELPPEATAGLSKRHVIRLDAALEIERPLEIFARLNIRHGPNTEQVVRELPLNEQDVIAEFDLAYTRINEKRVERAWVDLIFEGAEMNQIILRDVTMSRRPRAEF